MSLCFNAKIPQTSYLPSDVQQIARYLCTAILVSVDMETKPKNVFAKPYLQNDVKYTYKIYKIAIEIIFFSDLKYI